MMTTDTRPVVHASWCNAHKTDDENPADNWCEHVTAADGADVVIEPGNGGRGAEIRLWFAQSEPIPPATARAMAAALIEAAELVERA